MHFLTLWQASPQFLGVLANAVGTTRRKTSRRLEFIFFLCSWNWNLKTVTAQHLKQNLDYHCDGARLARLRISRKRKSVGSLCLRLQRDSHCTTSVSAQRKDRSKQGKASAAPPSKSSAPSNPHLLPPSLARLQLWNCRTLFYMDYHPYMVLYDPYYGHYMLLSYTAGTDRF